jgi:translocation and assembly module TamB
MDRRRALHIAAWTAGGLLGLVALALVAVLVVTNTDWGRERVRRFAVNTLNDLAHGTVRIGRLDGNLLEGLTASGISITDSTGAPLVTADTLSARFGLRALLGQRIELQDVRLVEPLIVLDKPPGGDWNFERIFPGDTTAVDSAAGPGWGSWFRIEELRIRDGRIIVRLPWEPDTALAGAARDSAVAAALSADARANVVPAQGGWQTVYDFQRLTAHFPLLRIADPDEAARRFEVATLRMDAYPFRPPAAEVRDLRGTFFVAEDSLWFTAPVIRFPASELAGSGTFRFGPGSSDIALRARPVSTADLRFAYPALPADGRGTLDVAVSIAGDTARYAVRDTDLRVERATLAGDLGLVLVGDTLAFRDTDLRFADVDTRLIERLAPGVEIPRSGVLSGRAALDGPLTGLDVDADVAFLDRAAGRNRVTAQGRVGVADGAVAANDLRITIDPLQVAMVRSFVPDLPVGGTVEGRVTMDGSTAGELLLANLDLTHRDRGERTHVTGRAGIRRSPSLYLDVDADLRPLSLVTVGRFAPGIGLRGSATGPLRVRGTLGDLALDTRLRFPDGGQLAAVGRLDLEGTIGYDVRARTELFNANTVVATAPRMSLTATASARGVGTDPATLRTELAADLATSSVDTVAVDSARVRVRAADGLATIDTVALHGPATLVAASGTFGLREDRTGEVEYLVRADSLGAFAHFLGVPDTTQVPPRPGIAARAAARARADSARVAEATMVERMATGRAAPPPVVVDTAPGLPADSVGGALYARGFARGNLKSVDVRGVAGLEDVVARGSAVGSARLQYAWVDGLTPKASLVAAARLDTIRAAGFALDSVDARVAYQGKQGTVDVVINQQSDVDYRARANFRLAIDESELLFQQLAVRFDTTTWEAARPGAVRWGPRGVFVDSLDLRGPGARQLFVHGLIPTEGEANLEARLADFQIADALSLLQSDVPARGRLTLNARLTGPATAPRLTGAVGMTDGTYDTAPLPNVRATLAYADETLTTQAELLRLDGGDRPLAVAVGEVPINLALKTEAPRLPERALRVDVDADSLPLGLIPQFTDALADVDGRAAGAVRVRGTVREPSFVGALSLVQGRARLVPLGVTLHDLAARVRLAGDTVVVDSLVGYNTGRVLVRGGLGIKELAQPSFDLYLVANGATVLDNQTGRVRADAGISARGPFDGVYVSGQARVTEGVIYLPATGGKNVVSVGDPTLMMVVDTTAQGEAELVPGTSPLVANLRANVRLAIERDTWVRSKEANVEIFTPDDPGPLEIQFDERTNALVLRGVVGTDRGEYVFQNRRFQIASGTATFLGQPEINPLLQATALYEVQIPAKEALTIRIVIGGTLQDLQLSLESDAQPPISQSDLISYLALGRSSSSLTQFNQGSSLTSGGATGGFVGAGTAFISQRLTGIGVGVLVDQLEGEAARSLGADVFDITPADVSIEAANPLNGLNGLLLGTQVEAGKYVNRRTFVALTARPSVLIPADGERAIPGIRVEHRIGERLRLEAVYEGRFRNRPPTLEEQQQLVSTGVLGLFMVREWGW